jgi:hypothetical protein
MFVLALHLLLELSAAGAAPPSPTAAALAVASSSAAFTELPLSEGSFWRPYLAVLPWTFSNVLYWRASHFQQLLRAGPPAAHLLSTSLRFLRNVVKHYSVLYHTHAAPLLPSSKSCGPPPSATAPLVPSVLTWAGVRWSLAAVMSRQNSLPVGPGGAAALCLVPGWDFINHEEGGSRVITTGYDTGWCPPPPTIPAGVGADAGAGVDVGVGAGVGVGTGALVHEALRDFAPGEEVCMYYGHRPNDQLLLYAGFSVTGNGTWSRKIPASLPVSSSDPLHSIR